MKNKIKDLILKYARVEHGCYTDMGEYIDYEGPEYTLDSDDIEGLIKDLIEIKEHKCSCCNDKIDHDRDAYCACCYEESVPDL